MLLGLDDFDVDMFLTLEDDNILIYYSDFETIPELANIVPLGSFDDETESYLWVNLNYDVRLQVGLLFMERDLYILQDPNDKKLRVDVNQFYVEFDTIPEVTNFFEQYKEICRNYGVANYPAPDSWEGWDDAQDWTYVIAEGGQKYIDWNTYPDWCQECKEYTYDPLTDSGLCAYLIPIEVMPPKDIYFLSVVYFNGIYRVNPEHSQDFGVYQMLTDVDFDLNKFSLIVDIRRFFTLEFQWFLRTVPGFIPFACDYGTYIKYAIQTKNTTIRQIEIQNEINFFIYNFNNIYGDLVQVEKIVVNSKESDTGGDEWLIEVSAKVKKERLIYRIEV